MARFALGIVAGMVISAIAGAAASIRASSPDDDPGELPAETVVTAIRVGLDPRALHGAVVTTHAPGAVAYLQHEGLLPKPPPITVEYEPPRTSIWTTLAQCESNGRWHVNSGNGYYGGLQFDRQTWLAYGGSSYAPFAHQASPQQQITIAERLRSARGYQPWPACRRILRLP